MFHTLLTLFNPLFVSFLFSSTNPIIFVHGHESDPRPVIAWSNTWNNPKSAMWGIINECYGGYTAGVPLHCSADSTPENTNGETKKIYNFSYYCEDGDSGAIGSNGTLRCSKVVDTRTGKWEPRESVPPQFALDLYAGVVDNNSWAAKLAQFIEKVRTRTGASKVDIVAHSMGAVVTRAAMKYYGAQNKVRKFLMIGATNHPYQHSFGEWIYTLITSDQHWQKYGEDFELDIDCMTGSHGINFETSDPESDMPWLDHMGYGNLGCQMATIAGDRGLGWPITIPNDEVVAVSQVKMGSSAEFEPTIYASHSYQGQGYEEVSEVTCT